MYATDKAGAVVTYSRIADRKTYKVYNIRDTIDEKMRIYRQDTTNNDTEGNRIWIYGTLDPDNNEMNTPVSNEQEWTQFENGLKEITFYGDEG